MKRKVEPPWSSKRLGVGHSRGCGMLGTIRVISAQELLGEIREIVMRIRDSAVARTDHGDLLSCP